MISCFRRFTFEKKKKTFEEKKKKVFESPSYDDDQGLVDQLVGLFVYSCGFFVTKMCLFGDVEIVMTTLFGSHS